MNSTRPILLLAAVVVSGCASHERNLVLAPVGPSTVPTQSTPAEGTLIVYSAPDHGGHFNGLRRLYYSDYQILSDRGTFLQKVRNDRGSILEQPAAIALRPGHYRVFAPANGQGWVTVPVEIAPNETTVVHLDDSSISASRRVSNASSASQSQTRGQIAGSPSNDSQAAKP